MEPKVERHGRRELSNEEESRLQPFRNAKVMLFL